jgi:hypothetical protein
VIVGGLEASEAPDVLRFIAIRENSLMATEAPDVARFNEGTIDHIASIIGERTKPPSVIAEDDPVFEVIAEDQPPSVITGQADTDATFIAKRTASASWEARP